MKTTHTLIATIPHGDPDQGAELECKITFTFLKGAPAQGPNYYHGGQPADPDEIEFVKAEHYCNGKPSPFSGVFADMEQSSLDTLAETWLYDNETEAYEAMEAQEKA